MQEALPAEGLVSQIKTQDRMIPQQVAPTSQAFTSLLPHTPEH